MWSKFTHALKPHLGSSTKDEPSVAATPQGEVMSKVFEQHPNLSMFHPNANESGVTQPPPGEGNSPSVHSKRNMFKRLSKPMLKDDVERARSPSPFQHSQTLPKKVRNLPEFMDRNDSQSSLPVENQEVVRRSSFDMLRPSPPRQPSDTTKSTNTSRQRPSLDLLRQDSPQTSPESMRHKSHSSDSDFLSAEQEKLGSASVRSILRDRNTPGTGQSVRFFSRDAFKVITPDHSRSIDLLEKPHPSLPQDEPAFLERLAQAAAPSSSTPLTMPRLATSSKPRPKLAGLFSQLDEEAGDNSQADISDSSFSLPAPSSPQIEKGDPSLFNISQQLDIPQFPPPGLDFNVNAPVFDASFTSSVQDLSFVVKDPVLDNRANRLASPPPLDLKGKGKQQPVNFDESFDGHPLPVSAPAAVDESIFHRKEKYHKLPPQLHERSQSFSFGQTVFFSMQQSTDGISREEQESAYPSSDVKPSLDSLDLPSATSSPSFSKVRTRAISDTAFQDMLSKGPSSERSPEADINDESSSNLVVYGSSEPDPFSANANTYYTPQVMIPITPPRGAPRHIRKTSKEENAIMSLQTELALKAELCAQYETDLKARDELVEILGKRLSDIDKDESKRKNALKSWKKKVQELERTCRQLEEAMDRSRMESMERSVMDEASGEALRMLHRQIAGLEREKIDWLKKEHGLKEEVETLEALVKERSEDVMSLKETLWSRDESELMLKEGIKEAKEQIDMIGNISMVGVDEDELRRLMAENQKTSEETQRFRIHELELMQELEEMKTKYEGAEVQTKRLEEQVEGLNGQLKAKDEEHATLKIELEAQWQHTEKMNEEIGSLEQENAQLTAEKDALRADVESLDTQITNLENQWTEDENKREELETELQEAWNLKDALEQESNRLEDALQHEREAVTELRNAVHEHATRVAELEEEKEFSNEEVNRLKDNLHQRDDELAQYTQRVITSETEVEALREEMSKLKREHSHADSQQARALEDAAGQQEELKTRMDEFVRAKAEADVELKTNKERIHTLKEEIERLRRQVHTLQQDSADKDIKIVQMTKQASQDKDDMLGLNIALESKQQELELIKRKLNVRGTAGSTPAPAAKVAAFPRRDSNVFIATPLSRPPSSMSNTSESDAGSSTIKKDRKLSLDTPQKAALARSNRLNGSGLSSATSSAVKVSMGPPTVKRPGSAMGTPTPAARASLARSSSARPAVKSPPNTPVHRRTSSSSTTTETVPLRSKLSRSTVNGTPAPEAVSEQDEKENVASTAPPSWQRNQVPVPA